MTSKDGSTDDLKVTMSFSDGKMERVQLPCSAEPYSASHASSDDFFIGIYFWKPGGIWDRLVSSARAASRGLHDRQTVTAKHLFTSAWERGKNVRLIQNRGQAQLFCDLVSNAGDEQ